MTEPDAPLVKPAPRTARRRLLVLGGAGLAVLLAVVGVVNYRQRTAPLRPALFVQTPGSLGDIQFTRDGRLLMTTEGDAAKPMVTFRDADTGQVVRQWPGGAEHEWLSEDGTRFLEEHDPLRGPGHCLLRDAMTGHVLRQWTGHLGDVRPDFSWMIMTTDGPYFPSKTAQVVDVATGRVVGRFSLNKLFVESARLSRHGPFLCLPAFQHPTRLLRLPAMTPVLTGLPPLRFLAVTQDKTRAYGVDDHSVLHFWSLTSKQHTAFSTRLAQTDWVTELNNGLMLVFGMEGTAPHQKFVMQVRSPDGSRLLRSLPGPPQVFSPDRRLMAVSRVSGSVKAGTCDILDLETGKRRALLNVGTDALGNSLSTGPDDGHLAIAPDDQRFVYATPDGLLRFYRPGKPADASAQVLQDSGRSVLSFTRSLRDAVVLPGGGIAACGSGFAMQSSRSVQV